MARFIHDMIAACPQPGSLKSITSKAVWVGKHLALTYQRGGGYWNRGWNPVEASFAVAHVGPEEEARSPGFVERQRAANVLCHPRPTTKLGVLALINAVEDFDKAIEANINEWRAEAAEERRAKVAAAEANDKAQRYFRKLERNAVRLKKRLEELVVAVELSAGADAAEPLRNAKALLTELEPDA